MTVWILDPFIYLAPLAARSLLVLLSDDELYVAATIDIQSAAGPLSALC